jgi:hypothetical protein
MMQSESEAYAATHFPGARVACCNVDMLACASGPIQRLNGVEIWPPIVNRDGAAYVIVPGHNIHWTREHALVLVVDSAALARAQARGL